MNFKPDPFYYVLYKRPARRLGWFNWFAILVFIAGALCALDSLGCFEAVK
jgi:hypothetical protein